MKLFAKTRARIVIESRAGEMPGASREFHAYLRVLMNQFLSYLVIFMALMISSVQTAGAQQVCYSYDSLGRLTGVIDQNGQAAFYVYDAAGNVLSIRRQSPTGPVTLYSFDPPSG